MKNRISSLFSRKSERVIATFGQATLVSLSDGGIEIRGGQLPDRTAAREWISLFMHEAVPRLGS
jgi:hypothetical protein